MQGQMYYGAPQGQAVQYGQAGQYGAAHGSPQGKLGLGGKLGRKRLNIVPVGLGLFVPWFVFCLVLAMLSFSMHYKSPSGCQAVTAIIGVVFGLLCIHSILGLIRRWTSEEADPSDAPTWTFFLSVTSIVALVIAVAMGDRNFLTNMQPYYDLSNLNSYDGVNPATMRGQELMDAGRVVFAPGSHLDISRSMGFKNQDVYCVAPITTNQMQGSAPLASYDFFAVGKNCCSGNAADFKCGWYNHKSAHGGVRLVRDDDRAFYRLAVQQAQSAFAIKSIHPLFFHWTLDPEAEVASYRQEAYKFYLIAMFGHFAFQFVLVAIAMSAFSQRGCM